MLKRGKWMGLVLLAASVLVPALVAVSWARMLGAREARETIARALGIQDPSKIHIKSMTTPASGESVVEATFDTAFRLRPDKSGKWQVAEVRTGDRCWESVELITDAIRKEKVLRTTADLRTIAAALEAFHRDRGFYVQADTGAALVDNLAPWYMDRVVRLDAWSREFEYKGSKSRYRLASAGPDGRLATADDIVFEDGKQVQGPAE